MQDGRGKALKRRGRIIKKILQRGTPPFVGPPCNRVIESHNARAALGKPRVRRARLILPIGDDHDLMPRRQIVQHVIIANGEPKIGRHAQKGRDVDEVHSKLNWTDDARGITCGEDARWNGTRHNGTGTHYRALANRDALENNCARANPHICTNRDCYRLHRLTPDRMKISVHNQHLVREQNARADTHMLLTSNMDTLIKETTVFQCQHGIARTIQFNGQTRCRPQGNIRSDNEFPAAVDYTRTAAINRMARDSELSRTPKRVELTPKLCEKS